MEVWGPERRAARGGRGEVQVRTKLRNAAQDCGLGCKHQRCACDTCVTYVHGGIARRVVTWPGRAWASISTSSNQPFNDALNHASYSPLNIRRSLIMRPWGCGSSEERSEERGEEVGGERSKFRQSRETPHRTGLGCKHQWCA